MRSIFRYNWKDELFDHANPQRIYAQDDEGGLLLCTWPLGKPERFPFPYSEEVWTGIEYSTAALLAYRGMVDEALTIVKALRARHDGERRNPFDEFECGHHYARAMASYAMLLALSGFSADLPHHRIAFRPRVSAGAFKCFFSVETGWGLLGQDLPGKGTGRTHFFVEVRSGSLALSVLSVSRLSPKSVKVTARLGAAVIPARLVTTEVRTDIVLGRTASIRPGSRLEIAVK
jgi:hypothetical protein